MEMDLQIDDFQPIAHNPPVSLHAEVIIARRSLRVAIDEIESVPTSALAGHGSTSMAYLASRRRAYHHQHHGKDSFRCTPGMWVIHAADRVKSSITAHPGSHWSQLRFALCPESELGDPTAEAAWAAHIPA